MKIKQFSIFSCSKCGSQIAQMLSDVEYGDRFSSDHARLLQEKLNYDDVPCCLECGYNFGFEFLRIKKWKLPWQYESKLWKVLNED